MRPLRFLGGSLIAGVVLVGCSDVKPTSPDASQDNSARIAEQTPQEITIHAVFSGPPNRTPNQISLDDPTVFVQILNIEAFIPRPASASDVRIGDSWTGGTPAQGFVLFDINGDGNRDIQLRWSTTQLISAGHLHGQTQQLTVWGRDPGDGQIYRGAANVQIILPQIPPCAHDNGGMITHPNGGTGPIAGSHVSMSSPAPFNTAGSNVRLIPPGPEFRVADDFTVGGNGCTLSEVVTHGYRTGGAPDWTGANINIRSGSNTGQIVATATTTAWEFTGIYRTFNGVLNNADRPIYRIRFSFNNITLPAGTYWIDWQVQGPTSGWANFVMEPNPANPNAPITVFGNGQQLAPTGWQPLIEAPGAETPFLVRGPGATPLRAHGSPVPARVGAQPAGYGSRRMDSSVPATDD
jgi:hypothetical protein